MLDGVLVDPGRERQKRVARKQVVARRIAVRTSACRKGKEEAERGERGRASSRGHPSPGGSRRRMLPRPPRARAAMLRGGQAASSSRGSVDENDFEWCLLRRRDLERKT